MCTREVIQRSRTCIHNTVQGSIKSERKSSDVSAQSSPRSTGRHQQSDLKYVLVFFFVKCLLVFHFDQTKFNYLTE